MPRLAHRGRRSALNERVRTPQWALNLLESLRHQNLDSLRVRHEYEYCDVYVNRSDDNMLDVCFQESQLTSDPTTTPQQCNKGDRQR